MYCAHCTNRSADATLCTPPAGGFATVYRAQLRSASTGGYSTVAVKVLRPVHLLRPMHLRRFLQEVAVQHAVCHPNVVKVGAAAALYASCSLAGHSGGGGGSGAARGTWSKWVMLLLVAGWLQHDSCKVL